MSSFYYPNREYPEHWRLAPPVYHGLDPRPDYGNHPPIHHQQGALLTNLGTGETVRLDHEWDECPNCGAELDTSPGADDGPTTIYSCEDCEFSWAD